MRRVPAPLVPAVAAVAGLPAAIAPGSVTARVSYLVVFTALTALGWVRLRGLSGSFRSGFTLVICGVTAWLAGDLLMEALTWLVGPFDDLSPSDGLWLAGYPLVALGLVRLSWVRSGGRLRESLLDAVAMGAAMAWPIWQFLVLPPMETQQMSISVLMGALYPLGDVLLFTAAAVLMLSPGVKGAPTYYLIASLTFNLLGDLAISILPNLLPGVMGDGPVERFDGLLMLANSLLVAAMLHPEATRIAEPNPMAVQRLHPARVVLLGLALLVLPTLAGLVSLDSLASRVSLICAGVVFTSVILIRFVLVAREQERVQAVLAHQAGHDQLTGLPNRRALHAQLAGALRTAAPGEHGPVLLYLDLDGFKQVNDRHGHAAGDALLTEFTTRLRGELRPDDVAARVGGDEFVVLCRTVADAGDIREVVERLRAMTVRPVAFGGDLLTVGVSIGVAAAGDLDRPDADALLAAADIAMYREKSVHRATAAELS